MTGIVRSQGKRPLPLLALGAVLGLLAGCEQPSSDRVQGYVEGEFVYIASPNAGAVVSLEVARGDRVEAGSPLFALENMPEKSAREEAERRLTQARASLEDLRKGKRPVEIDAVEAQLRQGKAALEFSESEVQRIGKLVRYEAGAENEYARVRAARDEDQQRVAQLEAELQTARLGAREDQIAAAAAIVRALEAALTKASWDLAEKQQTAPRAGVVFDTLYHPGEWVAAGRPVVALLPPEYVKVRAFVPQARVSTIQPGDEAHVTVDGRPETLVGRVSFISPRAEYTPPVIYSRESRDKLVFMVEIMFDLAVAATLHPGQPVDVSFHEK
jgi:HlyD family secretion protein